MHLRSQRRGRTHRRRGARAAGRAAQRWRWPDRGFTLLEVLVVIALFCVLASIGHAALRGVLDARERVAQELDRIQHLQAAFMLLERDLGQAIPRAVRDRHGGERPAFAAAVDGTRVVLELTHAGWPNPAAAPRSSMQRVQYLIAHGTLRRVAFKVLDGATPRAGVERVLLDAVDGAALRFLDAERRWHAQWPPAIDGHAAGRLLAVELVLDLKHWGRVRRLFALPPGSAA